jgi:hypothetical protein
MELLPVIYWSLFSVGVLALIVILFSFITFQFRKKYGIIPSEEVKGDERDKKVTVKNPDKKAKSKKKHHPKVQTRSRKNNSPIEDKTKQNYPKDYSLYKRPTKDSVRKRVEVLNPNPDKDSKSNEKFHSIQIDSKRNGWN